METNRRIRSDSEWMELITECRQSGLSDYAWCSAKNIPSSSFYNAVARLRKKACRIPEPSGIAPVIDLTSRKQDVVQIDIVPDAEGNTSPSLCREPVQQHLDNSHTIELLLNGDTTLRISNTADPFLLEKVLSIIRRTSC